MYRQFTLLLLLTPALLLAAMATVNLLVDPAEIYSVGDADAQRSHYVSSLLKSPNGIAQQGNERLVKRELLNQSADADCYLLGSSRAAQFSTLRGPIALLDDCEQFANLWVSAATLEDIWLIAQELLRQSHNEHKPRLLLAFDPWWFTPHLNTKYTIYQTHSAQFYTTFPLATRTPDRLANLINLDYFKAAWKNLSTHWSLNNYPLLLQPADFSASVGGSADVLLADGSLVYPANEIARAPERASDATLARHMRTNDLSYQQILDSLLAQLAPHFAVELVLAPYHPQTEQHADLSAYLRAIETDIRTLVHSRQLPVHGSFSAREAGCEGADFFDYLHPRFECLQALP